MNYGKLLMLKALDGDEDDRSEKFIKILKRGIDKSYFNLNPDYWDFVVEHSKKYGAYPSADTFKKQFGIEEIQVHEPVEFYIDELCKYKRFRIMGNAMDKADKLFEVGKIDEGISEIRRSFSHIDDTFMSDDLSIRDSVQERLNLYEKRFKNPGVDGVPSGLPILDKATYGWHPGEFTVVMAMLGGYKTWMLLFLAKAAIMAGFKPLVATVEMGKLQIARRLDAILTGVPFETLRSGSFGTNQDFDDFKAKMDKISHMVEDAVITGGSSFGEMFLQAKIEEHKPDILFVDGLYLMSDDERKKADWEALKSISKNIKNIAEINQIPIVATTQMDVKKAEKKAGKEMISFMNYSMGIAQAADNVISSGRIWDAVREEYLNEMIIKTLKLREGEPIRFKVRIDLGTMVLRDSMEIADNRSSTFSDIPVTQDSLIEEIVSDSGEEVGNIEF